MVNGWNIFMLKAPGRAYDKCRCRRAENVWLGWIRAISCPIQSVRVNHPNGQFIVSRRPTAGFILPLYHPYATFFLRNFSRQHFFSTRRIKRINVEVWVGVWMGRGANDVRRIMIKELLPRALGHTSTEAAEQ